VQVLVRGPRVLYEHLFGSGASVPCPVGSGGLSGAVEVSDVADQIDCSAGEMERACASTHRTVAQSRAATAGETEYRMTSQEADDVLACVRAKPTDDVQFTRSASTQSVVQLVTHAGLWQGSLQDQPPGTSHSL
jgi:hypothetical protein